VRLPGIRATDPDLDALIDTVDRAGNRWSVHPSGWQHPLVSGGEGEGTGSGTGEGGTGTGSGTGTGAGGTGQAADTVSKAEAQRLADQAKKDAEKALREQYGIDPDEVKKILDDRKAAEDARKDEVTKAQEAAAERERKAEEREREAAKRERAANVRAALLAADVRSDRLAKAELLVKVDDDADEEAIKAAVDAVKADTPEWFPTNSAAGPTIRPGGPRPVATNTASGIAAGRERARKEREARSANRPAFGEGLTVVGGS
jgi:hypothetical protein